MKQSAIVNHEGIWQCMVCNYEYSSIDYWHGKVRWKNCPQCDVSNKETFDKEDLIRKQADWHIDQMLGAHDEEVSD